MGGSKLNIYLNIIYLKILHFFSIFALALWLGSFFKLITSNSWSYGSIFPSSSI